MSLALPLKPGTLVASDFRVERDLARGGMGTLYVVTQLSTGHERVLKVMHSRLVADPRNRERFLQEARASARIESDHVVQVVAAGFDDQGIPWIIMELLRGEDLAAALARRGGLSPGEALEVFRQLGHALGAAHVAGLVHRDLKPENIFLAHSRREGVPFTVKLLDFGIAKLLEESGNARNTGALGTPLWMAPEQAERSPLSPASDVWAMGLVAFTTLTGKCYWHAGNLPEVPIERVLREVFVDAIEPASARAAALGCALPPDFDGWFARCVVRDPSRRFRNAAEAVAALVPVLMGPGPTSEVPVTAWSQHTPRPAGPFAQHTPAPQPPVDVWSPPSNPGAAPPGFGNTAHWAGATPPPSVVPYSLGSSPGRPSMPGMVTPSGPHAIQSQPGYFPSQPGYFPSQPGYSPSQPGDSRSGSSAWVLVGGLGFLAVALIVGGVALLMDRPHPRADAGVVVRAPTIDAGRAAPPPPRRLPQRRAVRVGTVGAGFGHTCALQPGGTVRCWGWCRFGQCGDGALAQRAGPTAVPGLVDVVELAVGYAHNCARLSNGTARCWGLNSSGQLGDGSVTNRAAPSAVTGLSGVAQLALGEGHTCALLVDQTVHCWGANGSGQLGDRSDQDRRHPVLVASLTGAVEVAAGGEHTCARRADGTVWCWGASTFGEVGDGWTRHHYEPARVAGLSRAVALGMGPYRSCAVRDDGSLWCWGRNDAGQIGDGTRLSRTTMVRVPGMHDVSDVALGAFHACAIGNDGALRCWGANEGGRLGDGTQVERTPAEPAHTLPAVFEVRASEEHSCARLTDHTVRCWGGNPSGQLGDGTTASRLTPTQAR